MAEVQPMKIIKACTTRWLTHGESTSHIISRFEPILDALDTIVYEKGDAEAKAVRDQLLEPSITLFLLLLAEVLAPVNIFSKYLQTSNLVYLSVTSKLSELFSHLNEIKESLQNHDSLDFTLKFFSKAMPFFKICNQRNDLGRNIKNRPLVPGDDNHHKEMIQEFIDGTASQFIDDLVTEIEEALSKNNLAIVAFNVFNIKTYPSTAERMEQFRILNEHYGETKVDNYDNHQT